MNTQKSIVFPHFSNKQLQIKNFNDKSLTMLSKIIEIKINMTKYMPGYFLHAPHFKAHIKEIIFIYLCSEVNRLYFHYRMIHYSYDVSFPQIGL